MVLLVGVPVGKFLLDHLGLLLQLLLPPRFLLLLLATHGQLLVDVAVPFRLGELRVDGQLLALLREGADLGLLVRRLLIWEQSLIFIDVGLVTIVEVPRP